MAQTRRAILSTVAGGALAGAFANLRKASAADDPIVLGATVPTTGPLSLTGKQYFNALTMAQEDINKAGGIKGRQLKIVIEDAGASNSTAVSAFVKLVQESRPSLAFLTSYSTQNLAVTPEVAKAGIPIMYAGGADAITDNGNQWMFRIRPTDNLAAQAMVRFMTRELRATKPGILYIQNDFGQGGATVAAKRLEEAGLKPVGSEAYGQNDRDFSAQMLRLRAAGADVILTFCYPADGALLLRQAKALGLKMPVVSSSAAFVPAALQLLSAGDLDNVWGVVDAFVDPSVGDRMRDFAERYKAKFGTDADPYGLAYYDGAMLAAEGLRAVGTEPKALRDWLANVKGWQGIGHAVTFDAKGNGIHDVAVIKAKAGTKTLELLQRVMLD